MPIPADKLYTMPAIAKVALSPDGNHISAVQFEEKESKLTLVDIATHEYVELMRLESGSLILEYQWLDNNHIFLKTFQNRRQKLGILTIRNAEEKIEPTYTHLDLSGNLVSTLDYSGKILFGLQSGKYQKLHKLTIAEFKANNFSKETLFETSRRKAHRYFFDENKRTLFSFKVNVDDHEIKFYYRQLDDYKWRSFFTMTSDEHTFLPVQFIDKKTMYVLSNQTSDKVGLYKFDFKSQEYLELIYEHPQYDLVSSEFNSRGNLHSVSFYEDGLLTEKYFDNSASAEQKKLKLSFEGKSVMPIAGNDQHQIVFVSSSDDPGSYYLYNKQENLATLIEERYPELAKYKLHKAIEFDVTSDDGLVVESYLTLPPPELSNKVLLVVPHGGPAGVRDYNNFNPESQFYVSRGFAVLRVNFRGSAGFGKSFQKSGIGEFGLDIERDITKTVNHVVQQYGFERRCAIGASYGGYSSVMLAIQHPNDYQCVVGAYGIYDLPLLFNSSNIKSTPEYREMTAKVVGEYSGKLGLTSPLYLLNSYNTPTLLIAGKKDPIAEFEHTRRLEYILDKKGNSPKTLYYKDTGHGHSKFFWQQHEAISIAEFLKDTLELEDYDALVKDDTELANLASDYEMLAQVRHFDSLVEKSSSTAQKYYFKAASMNHPESNFRLGQIHLDADEGKDAIRWFKKSAELGYDRANYQMGLMHIQDLHIEYDAQQAFSYFEQADKLGYSSAAKVRLAKFYCIGEVVKQDIQKCIELLSINHIEDIPEIDRKHENVKFNKKERQTVLARIYANIQANDVVIDSLKTLLAEELDIKAHVTNINLNGMGLLTPSGENVAEKITSSEFSDDDIVGIKFTIDSNSSKEKAAVFAHWQFIDSEGKKKTKWTSMLWGDQKHNWSSSYRLTNIDGKGTYKVTLKDSSGNVLLEQDFIRL
ncbi:prolyl oligopeptidase family serine peptidase [Shewanella sp. WXL01]|uniref:alpha/beta fold hydrolase n=1 Tax=Shewanella sp. WXL01 TaxID=2709721 RepID=UPI00143836BD|nr:alpha/beta fold hydrolase [Shewanella sp. WXL01]NKF52082.1 prolyl oligopeptidase family serine peptidase [Shewanella sp. WXL01]